MRFFRIYEPKKTYMPRVLHVVNRLNLGGITSYAAQLSKYLEPDFKSMLVAGMKDETEASSEFILKDLGLEPAYITNMYRSLNPRKDISAYYQLKKLIRKYKPDIVHTHAAKAGALGRLAAHDCGVPVVVHTFHGHVFHSYFGPVKTRFFLEIEKMLAKKSNRLIALSNIQKNELSNIYEVADEEKIEVIPLGFDLVRFQEDQVNKRIEFRQEYQIADDELAVGIIGRLVPIKNHRLFLEALKEVTNKTSKKIRAFIVGDGEEKDNIEALARQLNLSYAHKDDEGSPKATITFTSWIKDVERVYAGIDIVALTSLNEGTPVSLIEAQAAQKPIVTTEVGGVADVVIPNHTALLSPSGNVAHFSENLAKLVNEETLRYEMGMSGSHFVSEKFSYNRFVSDMGEMYDRLLWEASPEYRKIKLRVVHKNILANTSASYGKKLRAVYK